MKRAFIAENGLGSVFSLSIDSISVDVPDTTYFNYFELDTIDSGSEICFGWGGPECLKQDYPSWIGPSMRRIASTGVEFLNIFGDTLSLDLDHALNDTSVFYQDDLQRFSLILDQIDTASFLGIQDSIRSFTIIHQNSDGEFINSTLNGSSVIVGKELGLVEFFQIDSFPMVLNPLVMLGDAIWEIGLYQITPALVHDYQVGDVVQIHTHGNTYPPPASYNSYNSYTILDRSEAATHVNYTAEAVAFNVTTGEITNSVIDLSYSKMEVIAQIPFESFTGNHQHLKSIEECGQLLFEYRFSLAPSLGYCPEDTCWVGVDTNGPPPTSIQTYRLGIWTEAYSYIWTDPWDPNLNTSSTSSVVYYVKNGIPCGNEVILGLDENALIPVRPIFLPNPSNGTFRLLENKVVIELEIHDARGRSVHSQIVNFDEEITVGHLSDGLYMARIVRPDGSVSINKILIQH